MKQSVAVVMPAYNEEKSIEETIKKTKFFAKTIIIVDDGSSDKTLQKAQKQKVTVLSHKVNLGKGAAIKTGCEYAFNHLHCDAVVIMDADGQHNPEEIPNFEKSLNNGNNIVLGTRIFKANMPLFKFLGNKFASVIINIIFHAYISDIPSGYKAFKRKVYGKLKWKSQGYEVETEIAVKIAKNKLKFKEIPIQTVYLDRDKGFTILDSFNILLQLPIWIWGK